MATEQFNLKIHPKVKDLTGITFSRLTVLECVGPRGARNIIHWRCQCDCGKETVVSGQSLGSQNTQSCGCLYREKQLTPKGRRAFHDEIIGTKHGRLLVLRFDKLHKGYQYYLCLCDCGNEKSISVSTLRRKSTQSCGCFSREVTSKLMMKERGKSAFNLVIKNYRDSARIRGLSFCLTEKEFQNLIIKPCFYCGKQGENKRTTQSGIFTYTGLDRLDNTRGYELDNVAPCCTDCNMFKGAISLDDFIQKMVCIIERLNSHGLDTSRRCTWLVDASRARVSV